MKGKQLTMYDFGVEYKPDIIICVVQRPDGSTFEQQVQLNKYESPQDAIKRYQRVLGDPYGWRTYRGRRIKYIKANAYIVVDWRNA